MTQSGTAVFDTEYQPDILRPLQPKALLDKLYYFAIIFWPVVLLHYTTSKSSRKINFSQIPSKHIQNT